jgi:hypothetical protein
VAALFVWLTRLKHKPQPPLPGSLRHTLEHFCSHPSVVGEAVIAHVVSHLQGAKCHSGDPSDVGAFHGCSP